MCKEKTTDLEDMLLKAANTNIPLHNNNPPTHSKSKNHDTTRKGLIYNVLIYNVYNVSTRKRKKTEMKKEERKREKDAEKKGWRAIFKTTVTKNVPSKFVSYTQFIHREK